MDDNIPIEEQPIEELTEPKKKGSSMLLYIVGTMLSFVIITALLYFVIIRPHVLKEMETRESSEAIADSTKSVEGDSVALALVDSSDAFADSSDALVDSSDARIAEAEPLLDAEGVTLEDQVRILQMENNRRQKEIDHLWSELIALVEKVKPEALEEELFSPDKQKELEDRISQMIGELESAQKELATRGEEIKKLKEQRAEIIRIANKSAPSEVVSKTNTAKIYAAMKAQNAASILAHLNKRDVASILLSMRERQAAKILSAMQPDLAAQICSLMDKQKKSGT